MAHDIHNPDGIWYSEEEPVKVRLHYFSSFTSHELLNIFARRRDALDEPRKLAIAKLLFGKSATVNWALGQIRQRELA